MTTCLNRNAVNGSSPRIGLIIRSGYFNEIRTDIRSDNRIGASLTIAEQVELIVAEPLCWGHILRGQNYDQFKHPTICQPADNPYITTSRNITQQHLVLSLLSFLVLPLVYTLFCLSLSFAPLCVASHASVLLNYWWDVEMGRSLLLCAYSTVWVCSVFFNDCHCFCIYLCMCVCLCIDPCTLSTHLSYQVHNVHNHKVFN